MSAVRAQADQAGPPVKAAALLHIARVLTTIDQAEAERVLERGLALLSTLPEYERDILMTEAVAGGRSKS
ncbi:MAG TPA: hypothetical protein VNZ26_20995 [Vicinamibacterales bacterium]|nr:hypothetical protein [Vicinamibacterales bacterium]